MQNVFHITNKMMRAWNNPDYGIYDFHYNFLQKYIA